MTPADEEEGRSSKKYDIELDDLVRRLETHSVKRLPTTLHGKAIYWLEAKRKKAVAWLTLLWPVTSILMIGWLWVFLSLLLSVVTRFNLSVGASGSVLVCSAIVAELVLSHRWPLSYLREYSKKYTMDDEKIKRLEFPSITENFGSSELKCPWGAYVRMDALKVVRKESDFLGEIPYASWLVRFTVERVDKVAIAMIVISAIVGTVLWGYGDSAILLVSE